MTGVHAVVLVTHNPDPFTLEAAVEKISEAGALPIVIDNSDTRPEVGPVAAPFVVHGGVNRGIGWAHNEGLRRAVEAESQLVMFLDQDSAMGADMLRSFLRVAGEKLLDSPSLAAVSPLLVDSASRRPLVFHQGTLRTTLAAPGTRLPETVSVPFLPTSGMVVVPERFLAIGSFREDFFIDHVDREWGMRAVERGYELVVITSFNVEHELGDFTRTRGGQSGFFHTSIDRDYYLKRNTVLMVRAGRGGVLWRVGELCFAFVSSVKCCLSDRVRGRAMLQGFVDGIFGRTGKRKSMSRGGETL